MGARESFSIPEHPMTSKRLKSIRASAFHAQSGHCFYCGLPKWLASPIKLGLKPGKTRAFRCTVEHLVAQQDGGRDEPDNVVGTRARCSQCRHKRRGQPPPLKRSGLWFKSGGRWEDGGPHCRQG